jgi:hypothetical protein
VAGHECAPTYWRELLLLLLLLLLLPSGARVQHLVRCDERLIGVEEGNTSFAFDIRAANSWTNRVCTAARTDASA